MSKIELLEDHVAIKFYTYGESIHYTYKMKDFLPVYFGFVSAQ